MGQYFIIANTDKRQYFSAYSFGEGVAESQVVSGYHAQALALLTCKMDDVRPIEGTLLGSWNGDFVLATGEFATPDKHGITTSTSEKPERNIYQMARDEFEDIGYKAFAMLCETHEPICFELAERVAIPRYEKLIFHLGNVINQIGCEPLEDALSEVLGDWKLRYEKVTAHYAQNP